MTSMATTAKFRANTAGRNWISANHPNHACRVPVKSRNSSVIKTKTAAAAMMRIFLGITDSISCKNKKLFLSSVLICVKIAIFRLKMYICLGLVKNVSFKMI